MGIFGSSRAAASKLGCFGKLPTYGDFLSLNADGEEAQTLAAWLQDGVSAMPAANVASDQTLTFVWRPAGGRRTLVGALWPSADSAGRRFPFTLFAAYPDAQFVGHGALRLIAAENAWRRMREVHVQATSLSRVGDQYGVVDTPAPAPPEPRDVQQAFARRVHALRMHREDATPLAVQVQQIGRYASALRDAVEVPDFAVRMRLTDAADPTAEATAWLRLLLRRLDVDDVHATLVLRFTRAGGRSLYVFHRALETADLAYLLAPTDGYRRADSIGFQAVAAAPSDARAVETFQRAWASSAPSLAVLLGLAGCPVAAPENGSSGAPPFSPETLISAPTAAPVPPRDESSPSTTAEVLATDSGAAASGDGNEITGEMLIAAAPPPRDVGPTASAPPTTGGVPITGAAGEAPITDDVPGVVSGAAVIETRIRELASRPMLDGRLVRASTSAASVSTTGESAAGATVLLYLEDGGQSVILEGIEDGAIRHIEQQVADHAEALRLIEELKRLHDASEQRLQRAVEDACARTPRPGGRS